MENKTSMSVIEQEASPWISMAQELQIEDEASLTKATEMLSRLNTTRDALIQEKERVTKPLLEALANERSRWKPLESLLNDSIALIRTHMSEYATEQKRRNMEALKAIANRVAPGKGHLSVESAVKQMEKVKDSSVKPIETQSGTLKFRPLQRLKITSPSLVPDLYWIIDESRLLTDLKAGKEVTGAEIYVELIAVNKR